MRRRMNYVGTVLDSNVSSHGSQGPGPRRGPLKVAFSRVDWFEEGTKKGHFASLLQGQRHTFDAS